MTMKQRAKQEFKNIKVDKTEGGFKAVLRREGYPDIVLTEQARETRTQARKDGQNNFIELYRCLVVGGRPNLK